jgi:hypothetical protein
MRGHHFSFLYDDEGRARPALEKEREIRIYLKPITNDRYLDGLDKNSRKYRIEIEKRMCFTCPKRATQKMCYEMKGCIKIEKYCDVCALKFANKYS